MLRVGFESTIPVFEQAKMVHALDRAATVSSGVTSYNPLIWETNFRHSYTFYHKCHKRDSGINSLTRDPTSNEMKLRYAVH
jgi:hypothetical protein